MPRPTGITLLLSQLGADAAARFAEALVPLDLTPPLASVLRLIATRPGISQRELALALGAAPSRVVTHLDDLEGRGAIVREKSADRRMNRIVMTEQGDELFARVRRVVADTDRATVDGLDDAQRLTLTELLTELAGHRGITPGVHPNMGAARSIRH
ncbi:MAG: MarR family transcriptional regulator [Williamsia herbipolensis]|nr:MarR family transcriptional regulator [Williamsia herbipolensis]